MNIKRNLLVVTHGIPHPSRGASSVLFYKYICAFKSSDLSILHLIIDVPRSGSDEELLEYKNSIGIDDSLSLIYDTVPVAYKFSYKKIAIEPVSPSAKNTLKGS